MTSEQSTDSRKQAVASLEETSQKVQAAVLPSIDDVVNSTEFSKRDMLDFLEVKNSLMLSYMIDLTMYIRNQNSGARNEGNVNRLTEMKTALDKMRGLDKKLRYQIEKLLNAGTSASTFASGGDNIGPEDPLQFRPNIDSFDADYDSSKSQSEDSDDPSEPGDENDDESEGDDDLQAARATLSLAKEQKSRREDRDDDDGIYHAPRLAAVPYAHDLESKQKEKEKRTRRRLRATELAQTLRAEYGDAPEQEDMHGGSDYGRQRAAARRLAEREAEKTRAEEEGMVRLMTSRKEKKEKKRLMRMENSNLSAIADLGNLIRETRDFGQDNDEDDDSIPEPGTDKQRYHNGKRRRVNESGEGQSKKRGKMAKAKNSLQAALYATEGKKKKKKSKR